jgi:membrane protease subunit HflK
MSADHHNPAPKPELKLTPAMPVEDVSTQALSEALKSSFFIVKIALVILTGYFCCSNFFSVSQNERAVILRCGRPVGEGEAALLGPGLHAAFPYPIDEVVKIPAVQILSASSTIGWYRLDPRQPAGTVPPPPTLNPLVDGYTLTGDGNIIHLQATLRYRITEPLKYYFGFTNTMELVTNALNNALLYASAQFMVDDALRRNLAGLQEKMTARLEVLVAEQQLGVAVQQVDIVTAAPRQVKESFDAVTAAENERSTKINEAQAYANEILAKAKGEANARLNAGETDRTRLVEDLSSEAAYFSDLLPTYKQDPGFFARRLQVEYLARVMTNAQEKFFLPARADGKPRELRLQLNREPPKLKAPLEAPKTGTGHSHE